MTASDVAAFLKISTSRVRELDIPAIKLGPRRTRYDRADVEAYVERLKSQCRGDD